MSLNQEVNSNYIVQLRALNSSLVLLTAIPAEYQIGIQSNWDNRIGGFLESTKTGSLASSANAMTQTTGYSLYSPYLSQRSWSGNSPFSITLDFVFEASKDAFLEVIWPIYQLLSLASPSIQMDGNANSSVGINDPGAAIDVAGYKMPFTLLKSPGPTPSMSDNSKRDPNQNITLQFGRYMKLEWLIIRSVVPTILSRHEKQGYPLSATVRVEFEAVLMASKGDVAKMFGITSNMIENASKYGQPSGHTLFPGLGGKDGLSSPNRVP